MGGSGRLSSIEQAFAEAAVDPSRWNSAMECAAKVTGSEGAIMFPVKGKLPGLPMSRSMEVAAEAYFREGWHLRDHRDHVRPMLDGKGVGTDLDFITTDEMGKHPYYQDFLARFGLRWFAGIRVGRGGDEWCLSVQRKINQDPFSPEEQRRLGILSKRIAGTAALARALGFARADTAMTAFEASGRAAVLLDKYARVYKINETASRLFGPDLQITHARLTSWNRQATDNLDRALSALLLSFDPVHQTPPIILPRLSGRPIVAYPMRLSGISTDIFSPCRAVVVLIDLDRKGRLPPETLQACFDLTTAEAKLAAVVATGIPVAEAAHEMGVSYETARCQLKSIFSKTDTHRQADLVNLLSPLGRSPREPDPV